MSALRLMAVFVRLGAMGELAYRANFLIQLVESLLSIGSVLGVVAVVVGQTDSLGGWSPDELTALVGIYFVMLGLINLVISPSLSQFMEDVRDGKLDYTLVKPRDAQLLVSVSQFHVFKLIDVGLGIAVVVYAALRLGTSVGTGAAMSLLATLVLGSAIVYGFWMALATLAFWFIRIENLLWIFWMVYGAGRWPVDIYPGWMRWALTLIVPIAFAVTVPAEALTGRLQPGNFALATALAVAAVAGSRAFWKLGLRHYSGASA